MKLQCSVLLSVLLVASLLDCQAANFADDWETDATEVADSAVPPTAKPRLVSDSTRQTAKSAEAPTWRQTNPTRRKIEAGVLLFIIVYIINIIVGRRANDSIANKFGQTFCLPDGIFDKNFTMVGAGHSAPLVKESASQYRLYCSGRRFCKSLSATLQLKKRQDIFSLLFGLIWPDEDKLNIDVYMKDGCVPLTVIAVATKKVMRGILQEETGEDDVRTLTRKLEVKIPGWPADKLVVQGEHSSIFQELISSQLLDAIFRRPAFDAQSKYFRLLHITPEQSYGPQDQKAVIRFSFALPRKDSLENLTKLLSSVGVFIDLVGNFKLSPDLQKRAEKLRQDVDRKDDVDKTEKLRELAEERQNKKRLDEAEKLRRMNPEQREKFKEKRDKIMQKRAEKKMMKRM